MSEWAATTARTYLRSARILRRACTVTQLSIVITSFNRGRFLREAVASALNQEIAAADLSVVIVDDGSTDPETLVALADLESDQRVQVQRQENLGVGAARNAGIFSSRGKYILCLDDDDIISESYARKAIQVLDEDDSVGAVYTLARKFGAVDASWQLPEFSTANMALQNCVFASAVFRRHDWQLVGGYCESLRSLEDWDFWIRLIGLDRRFHQIPEELFFYRVGHVSRSKPIEGRNSWLEIVNRNRDFFSSEILAICEDRLRLALELERWKSRYSAVDRTIGPLWEILMQLARRARRSQVGRSRRRHGSNPR